MLLLIILSYFFAAYLYSFYFLSLYESLFSFGASLSKDCLLAKNIAIFIVMYGNNASAIRWLSLLVTVSGFVCMEGCM